MQYMLPRLRGWGESLSRQVGGRAAGGVGIGGRGPGETKIEMDRRRIRPADGQAAARDRGHEDRARRQALAARRPARPQRRARRLHQRRQVLAAQPAHRRRACWSRTRCSPPWTRPCAAPRPPTAASTPSPTPSGSSGTCRTSWSRRSARRWRRSPRPTCIVHVVDAVRRRPRGADPGRARACSPTSTPSACPSCSCSTRSTPPTPETLLRLRRARAGRRVRLGPHRRRARRAAARDRRTAAAPGHRGDRAACPTPAATSSPGCTSSAEVLSDRAHRRRHARARAGRRRAGRAAAPLRQRPGVP